MQFYKDGKAEDSKAEGLRMKSLRLDHANKMPIHSK